MEDQRAEPEVPRLESLLLEARSVRGQLDDFALRASHRLGPDTEVSITLRHDGHDRLAASSSRRAARCDEAEHAEQGGPCLTAMERLQLVLVPDIAAETRWPTWRGAALDAGFRSSAGVPAHVEPGAEIALNLYSTRVDAWAPAELVHADMLAQDIARTVLLCLEIARLTRATADAQAALAARTAIDRAVSAAMSADGLSAAQALEVLRDAARRSGADPAEVAQQLLAAPRARTSAPGSVA